MKMREVTDDEKTNCTETLIECFDDVRSFLNTLQRDMCSDDLKVQGVSIWLAGAFCEGYSNFVKETMNIDKKMETLSGLKGDMKSNDLDRKETLLL